MSSPKMVGKAYEGHKRRMREKVLPEVIRLVQSHPITPTEATMAQQTEEIRAENQAGVRGEKLGGYRATNLKEQERR